MKVTAEGWKVVRLGDIADIYDGPHATPKKTESGPIFLGISNLVDGRLGLADVAHLSYEDFAVWTRRVTPLPGDVVFSYETRLGEAAMVPDGLILCLGRRMGLLRAKSEEVDPRFLLYAYLGPQFQATIQSRTVHGSTVDRIPLNEMAEFPIRIPDLKTQRRIAHILGTLDDKIELNRQMNETLEGIARALFKSWFVDFDPVRAKAKGREPYGMDSETAALFPDSFEDSELGPIPSGWRVATIAELAEIVGGSTPSTKEQRFWENGCHAWATPKDLAGLSVPVLLDTERRITDAGLDRISSGLLPAGTVLLSSRAPIGYLAISEIPVAINQGFIAMNPRTEVPNLFLLYWAMANHELILSHANGSTFLEINKANFRRILLVIPTTAVLKAFDRASRPFFAHLVCIELESKRLAAIRDALLPQLISGRFASETSIASPVKVSCSDCANF